VPAAVSKHDRFQINRVTLNEINFSPRELRCLLSLPWQQTSLDADSVSEISKLPELLDTSGPSSPGDLPAPAATACELTHRLIAPPEEPPGTSRNGIHAVTGNPWTPTVDPQPRVPASLPPLAAGVAAGPLEPRYPLPPTVSGVAGSLVDNC